MDTTEAEKLWKMVVDLTNPIAQEAAKGSAKAILALAYTQSQGKQLEEIDRRLKALEARAEEPSMSTPEPTPLEKNPDVVHWTILDLAEEIADFVRAARTPLVEDGLGRYQEELLIEEIIQVMADRCEALVYHAHALAVMVDRARSMLREMLDRPRAIEPGEEKTGTGADPQAIP